MPRAGILLSSIAHGGILKLQEGATQANFYIAKHDYENGLNGAGRTLLVRKDCYDNRQWHGSNVNAYASSAIDSWLGSTYKALFSADIQAAMGTTKFSYTPGNGNNSVTTLQRAVFLLSITELGLSHSYANVEGSALPIAATLIAYLNGSTYGQWTRSPSAVSGPTSVWCLRFDGIIYSNGCSGTVDSRPAFTLPRTLSLNPTPNPDGSYSPLGA